MFNISDKVVCIANTGQNLPNYGYIDTTIFSYPDGFPIENAVYVIKNVVYNTDTGYAGLQLIGCPVIYIPTGTETAFDSRQFRKLEDIKQENLSKIKNEN